MSRPDAIYPRSIADSICNVFEATLDQNGIMGMNFVNTMGYGNQNGVIKSYNGKEYKIGSVRHRLLSDFELCIVCVWSGEN